MFKKFFDKFKKEAEPEHSDDIIIDESEQSNEGVVTVDAGHDEGVTEVISGKAEPLKEEWNIEPNTQEDGDVKVQEEVIDDINEDITTEEVVEPKKPNLFQRFVAGLEKTRSTISNQLDQVLRGRTTIDEDLYEELEDSLIASDMGVNATMDVMDELRDLVDQGRIKEPSDIKNALNKILKDKLLDTNLVSGVELSKSVQTILLVVGVNGVGKTTTIGKLAHNFKRQGHKVMLAAADTFRAAAIEQLTEWSTRANVDIVAHKEGSDPASVIYDAIQSAKSKEVDVLICDTAGRLHNKKNLMNELEKINRVIDREFPDAKKEVLLVVDGTTGQNAVMQAREFKQVTEITGLILTKLDGTAKGGVVFPLQMEIQVPVRYIGIGEGIDNLEVFEAESFVDAIIS